MREMQQRSALSPLAGDLTHILVQLQECTTVSVLFSRAAELVLHAASLDRALVLVVDDDRLTPRGCGPLADEPSDLLRRELLGSPIPITPQSREGRWLRLGVGPDSEPSAPSVLEKPRFGFESVVAGAIVSEGNLLALLVGLKAGALQAGERFVVAATAAMVAVSLSRLVLDARLREVERALRDLSVSAEALIGEALRAPVQVPSETGRGVSFPPPRRSAPDARRAASVLTEREIEVAVLLADGRTDREIAQALVISVNTAKDHVARIRRKLKAANRAEAAAKYLRLAHDV